ncbi:transcriptional regulator [Ammoniphilus oxalaticus]|uniref:Transcriptional regulator n=1 Tax=Ammoniphilus oxalaticus TaxID=66863 RepID=A0A419SHA0_9BACL|nr:helix-turn-helix domain-containing protein [Ammoniphilus oxalaticus]RKD23158.1 transcriptional regulator [Ammoniphilus oxalaticus]
MIGQRIKRLREERGYSITELASLAEVSKSYLSYIERNLQNNPSLQFLTKVAVPLETTLEFLLEDTAKEEDKLDEEWKQLIQNGIEEGMSKEDFQAFKDFIRFKKWKNNEQDN